MKRNLTAHLLMAALCASLIVLLPQKTSSQSKVMGGSKQVFTGNVIFLDGTFGPGFSRGRTGTSVNFFTLTVTSFTPESDVQNMISALRSGGQDGLHKALKKEKRGILQIGTSLGRDVQAVWMTETSEGRKVCALSERWLNFGELRRGARSVDYPFTYIEIYVDENGKGEGSLIPAARVESKGGNNIEVENFGIYPARLTNIKTKSK